MKRYLLDTNHVYAAIQPVSKLRDRVRQTIRRGISVGTCIPALCETEMGIQGTAHLKERRRVLTEFLTYVKIWPMNRLSAEAYGEVALEAKAMGRVLSQVDLMLAALARIEKLTIVTTDKDFAAFPDIAKENWLT